MKDEANASFKDDIIEDSDDSKLVNNSYFVNTIGTHKFSGEIRHPFDIIKMNNDTEIQVVDIGDYHKGITLSWEFLEAILFSILVPYLIIWIIRKFKKCKDTGIIILVFLGTILVYAYYIYKYLFSLGLYQDTVILESIPLSLASMILLYNYLCIITQKPCVFGWNEIPGEDDERLIKFLTEKFDWVKAAKIEKIDADKSIKISTEKKSLLLERNDKDEVILKIDEREHSKLIAKMENGMLKIYEKPNRKLIILQIVLMIAFTLVFHYNLPFFLLNGPIHESLLAIFGLFNVILIFANGELIRKIKERGITQTVGCIISFLVACAVIIYLAVSGPIVFSPKLGLLEIITIIFAELMPLITITITGMCQKTAISFLTLIQERCNG